MLETQFALVAQEQVAGTDWTAVGSVTAVVTLVVTVANLYVAHLLSEQRRKKDSRRHYLLRRVDRAERHRLLTRQLAADRRSRLAGNLARWLQSMSECLIHRHNAVLAVQEGEELARQTLRQGAAAAAEGTQAPPGPRAASEANHLRLQGHEEAVAEMRDFVTRAAELMALAAMIAVDEDDDADLQPIAENTKAMSEWNGQVLEEGQLIIAAAERHVLDRANALRHEQVSGG